MVIDIAYWHWLIFGMALLIAAVFLAGMSVFRFG